MLLVSLPMPGVAAAFDYRLSLCHDVVILPNAQQSLSLCSTFLPSASKFIAQSCYLKTQRKRRCYQRKQDETVGTKRLKTKAKATLLLEQAIQSQTWEEQFDTGPLSGDLAEIEAFCRIQRLAEHVHKNIMDCLRRLEEDKERSGASLEERVVAGLACIGATLQQGRMEFLGECSHDESEKYPRLAQFRTKLRRCCQSLQTALEPCLSITGGENLTAYRSLQRLNNICLDAGFPRPEGAPCHADIPNLAAVRLQPVRSDEHEAPDFWRGGQITEEGLEWLIDHGFTVVVDLRAEKPENALCESAIVEAEASGKIKRVKIPVQVDTAPTMEQVQEFAELVAQNKPLFLHSYAGIVRTSAMISRWREFVSRGGLEGTNNMVAQNDQIMSDDAETTLLEVQKFQKQLEGKMNAEDNSFEVVEEAAFKKVKDAFEAQMPGPNIFSRKDMSEFFKQRIVTPKSFCNSARVAKKVYVRRSSFNEVKPSDLDDLSGPAGRWVLAAANNVGVPTERPLNNNGGLAEAASDDEPSSIEGDMCASKTGVVRLQSRKKAEMYLVRTDGFTCTREKVRESTLAFTHPSTQQQMLMWKTAPKTVLLLKKLGNELMEEAKQVASFLYHQEGMNVMVEPEVHDGFARFPGFGYIQTFYNHDISELHERVDFVVCLGGDGVILHASNLFRSAVPPVVSFNLGSLGFLTAHPFEDYKHDLRAIIHGNKRIEGVYITLRMRMRCEIFRDGKPIPGKVFEVLNEVVVDRGSNPYLCKIECYERNRLITKVQADGVLVATPTGSTAYSTAAGGSMVHPNVPCMLFTPICPHSLSFRPVILPDSALLELKVPQDARSSSFVSFDGKRKQPLKKGESIRICMSEHPMSTVNKSDQTDDWFASLSRCFGWNQRAEQKSFPK